MKIRKFNEDFNDNFKLNSSCLEYLNEAIETCYDNGGNGMIIEESLTKCAQWLDDESYDADRHSPENPGYYTKETQQAFKDFVDMMVQNEIDGNPSNPENNSTTMF